MQSEKQKCDNVGEVDKSGFPTSSSVLPLRGTPDRAHACHSCGKPLPLSLRHKRREPHACLVKAIAQSLASSGTHSLLELRSSTLLLRQRSAHGKFPPSSRGSRLDHNTDNWLDDARHQRSTAHSAIRFTPVRTTQLPCLRTHLTRQRNRRYKLA